jgi:hypothetical protein
MMSAPSAVGQSLFALRPQADLNNRVDVTTDKSNKGADGSESQTQPKATEFKGATKIAAVCFAYSLT